MCVHTIIFINTAHDGINAFIGEDLPAKSIKAERRVECSFEFRHERILFFFFFFSSLSFLEYLPDQSKERGGGQCTAINNSMLTLRSAASRLQVVL